MVEWVPIVRRQFVSHGLDPVRHGEMIDELAEHLAEIHAAAIASGASADEAMAASLRELAGLELLAAKQAGARRRDVRRHFKSLVADLGSDLRQAVRLIATRRAFSAVAVSTLAIGIGLCTTVFSIFSAVLLKPLPYPDAGRLVLVWEAGANTPADPFIVAAPVYEDWRSMSKTLTAIGIWENLTFNVAGRAEPEQVLGIRTSASLFEVLGVAPTVGRTFAAAEDGPGHTVAVISDRLWRSQLAGDRSLAGRTIRLNGRVHDVIGVMPRGFEFPRSGTDVWIPIGLTDQDQDRDSHSFYVAGRLAPDATFEAALAEFDTIGRSLGARHDANRSETSTITRMSEFGLVRLRPMLAALFGAVLLVLVIACVNVANLQIGLALSRRREFALRVALGAGAGRVARQLLIESLTLGVLGGAGGVLLAWFGSGGVGAVLGPDFLSFWFRGPTVVAMDMRVVSFAVALSLGSALVFGFAPLAGLRRADLHRALHASGRGATRSGLRTRRILVAAEVALAIVVLSGAALLIKSLSTLLRVDPGLDPANVITLQVSLPQADTYGPAERALFCEDLVRESAGRVPVSSIGAVSHLPLSGANAGRALTIDGRPAPAPGEGPAANYRISCPGYFQTLGIPLISGRDFAAEDRQRPVVIINRVVADRYWPGQRPLGQRLKIGSFTSQAPWLTIVGVVENVRHFGLESEFRREIFVPYGQAAWPVMTIVAKTRSAISQSAVAELRGLVRRVDPELPVAAVRPMSDVIGGSVTWRQSFMRLLTTFAIVGLVLSAVGVYGVLAYFVSHRTRELGVRVALGASRQNVIRLVVRQSALPLVAGVAAGIGASFLTGRFLNDLLYEVRPGDPVVMLLIAGVLAVVGVAASWIPAQRAASVDPLVALRDD